MAFEKTKLVFRIEADTRDTEIALVSVADKINKAGKSSDHLNKMLDNTAKYEVGFRNLAGAVSRLISGFSGLGSVIKATDNMIAGTFSGLVSFGSGISKITSGLNGYLTTALKTFDKFQNKLIAINQAMELAGRISGGLQAAFDKTIGKYANFETALVGVGKTSGASGARLEYLGLLFDRLSHAIPATTTHLLGLAETAGQMNVAEADLLKFAETMARVEASTDIKGQEGATMLARIMGNTGDHINNLDRFASAMVALGNTFKTTEAPIASSAVELSKTMQGMGAVSHEVLALGAVIKDMGSGSEVASSVVGEAFRKISKVVRTTGAEFRLLEELTGLSGKALREAFNKSSVDVFHRFLQGLSKYRYKDDTLAIFDLKGDEALKVLPTLAGKADEVRKALDLSAKSYRENTAASAESSAAFATLNSKIEITKNVFTSLGRASGSLLAPAFGLVLDGVTALTKGLLDVIEWIGRLNFSALIEPVRTLGVAFGFLGGMLGGVYASFKSAAILAFLKNISLVRVALAMLRAPLILAAAKFALIGTAVIAIVAPIDLAIRNIGKMGDVWKWVTASASLGMEKVKEYLIRFAKWSSGFFGKKIFSDDDVKGIQEKIKKLESLESELSKKIDTGMIGGLSKFVASAFADPEKYELRQGEKETEKAVPSGIQKLTPEKIKEINSEYIKLAGTLDSVSLRNAQAGHGSVMIAKLQMDADLKKIAGVERNVLLAKEEVSERLKVLNLLKEQAKLKLTREVERSVKAVELSNKASEIELLRRKGSWEEIAKIARDHNLAQISGLEEQLRLAGMLHGKNKEIIEDAKKGAGDRYTSTLEEVQIKRGGGLSSSLVSLSDSLKHISPEMSAVSDSLRSAAASSAVAYMGAASAMLDAAKSLIRFFPDLINNLADVISMLTNLPADIFNAVNRLADSALKFMTDLFDNIGEYSIKIFEKLADFLSKLPDALADMMEDIPELFSKISDKIPEITENLIAGLIKATPRLVAATLKFMAIGLPRVVWEAFRGVFKQMVSMTTGIFSGFSNFQGMVPADPVKSFQDFSGKTSNLFSVQELDESLGVSAFIKEVAESLGTVFDRGKGIFSQLAEVWHGVWGALKTAGGWVAERWKETGAFLSSLWASCWELLQSIGRSLADLWAGCWNALQSAGRALAALWGSVWESMKDAGGHVARLWDNVREGLLRAWSGLGSLGKNIWDGFSSAVSNAYSFIYGVGGKIWDGLQYGFEHATDFLKKIGGKIADGLKSALGSIVGSGGGGGGWNPLPNIPIPRLPWKTEASDWFPKEPSAFTVNTGALKSTPISAPKTTHISNTPVINLSFTVENIALSDMNDPEKIAEKLFDAFAEKIRSATESGRILIHTNGVTSS